MRTSQTKLSESEKCPRRYAYRYVVKVKPPFESARLWLGTAVHRALAVCYAGGDTAVMLAAYDAECAAFPHPEDEKFQKGKPVWRERVERYRERWQEEPFEVVMVPEQELEAQLGNHTFGARVDLIVRMKSTGAIWVMDHKTADKTGPSYYSQFFIDKQGTSYVWAAEKVLGEEVSGWFINVLKGTKDGWYEREAFPRSRLQLKSFERQTIWQLDNLESRDKVAAGVSEGDLWSWVLDTTHPQHTHQCHVFGTCPFLSLCQVGKAALPAFKKIE